jgi:hypothetical protein
MLHTYHDGSILKTVSAKELMKIPIWKGNRILDTAHVEEIKQAIGPHINRLDSGYSIVKYKEEYTDGSIRLSSYLIDGQHRASVIRDFYTGTLCEPDFLVTVREKVVDSESDAIEYFNVLNNVKAQSWKTEPNILINMYIKALETQFNKNKKCLLIRSDKATKRPYLSANTLRETLAKHIELLKHSNEFVTKFVERVSKHNKERLEYFALELTRENMRDVNIMERAISVQFALAYDVKQRWVREILLDIAKD